MRVLLLCVSLLLVGCAAGDGPASGPEVSDADIGFAPRITPFDARLASLIDPKAEVERLASGYQWSEGPMWLPDEKALLFNDVPANTMYRWSRKEGARIFMQPSGLAEPDTAGIFREPGANGMVLAGPGQAIVADHGLRAVVMLDLATRRKTVLADRFEGRRFNSPNDVVRHADGRIYFTDPPYGLRDLDASPAKEQPHNGVYRIDPDGSVVLIDAQLSYPNGIALSPDGNTLYVANSDPAAPIWMRYALDSDGNVTSRSQFFDASPLVGENAPGLPDGMAVASSGEVFATGPGGVLVLSSNGELLGRIATGSGIANCAFGDDGSVLYMTSHRFLARVPTRARGLGF